MTDVYTQESASKKKFLAPLLVILLCMVSLTAAGYAYSATVDNTDDKIIIDGVTMELKNGTDIVTGAMYTFDDIGIDTHTTNGKAVIYSETIADAVGFTTAAAQAAEGVHKDKVTDKPVDYGDDLDNFITGYYVEVYKNNVAVGYKADLPELTKVNFAENATAANGMYKYATDYTLTVVNGSDADIKVKADLIGTLSFEGVKNVYLVVKLGDNIVGVTDLAAGLADVTDAISNDGEAQDFTVEAWIALSDFASENNVPSLDSSTFAVHFETVAA